jgi:hemerythrin-like domain-containing protein
MSNEDLNERRDFIRLTATVGAGLLISACSGPTRPGSNESDANGSTEGASATEQKKSENQDGGSDVSATEDLMREHGVLRRALLVYDSAARKLRTKGADVPPDALQKTATLFRAFGEDYHESKLEEAYIFPAVKKTPGPASNLADILLVQHQRGREITDYILALTKDGKLTVNNSEQFAKVLDSFVLMYQHHAAREDTILFPAWKQTMSEDELDDMSDKFEEIEHQQFGQDGFESAVKQIGEIETQLGIADISLFTPSSPPKV